MSRSQLRRTILESEVLVVDENTVEIAGVRYRREVLAELTIDALRDEVAGLVEDKEILESLIASATDLANTYAREHGVEEAASPEGVKGVIERLAWKLARYVSDDWRSDPPHEIKKHGYWYRRALPEGTVPDGRYLVWSNEHRAWWRADRRGYTNHLEGAGRYSRSEAVEICEDAHSGWVPGETPPEIPVAEADALACAARGSLTESEDGS